MNKINITLCMMLLWLFASCITGKHPMENEALKLLKKSEAKFNEYYKDKPIDLSFMDLSGMTIKKAVLVNADLHYTILTKTKFIKQRFCNNISKDRPAVFCIQ